MMSFALLLCTFAFTMGAFAFSGALVPMAASLGVTVGEAAALQSGFAIACAICGPVLAKLTSSLPRKPLLLTVLMLMTVLNFLSAMVPGYGALMASRVLVGGVGALAFPLATAIASAGATEDGRPAAVAKVYAGIPLAMIVGIPVGSVLGNTFGWQACFAATGVVSAVAFALVLVSVPSKFPMQQPTAGAREPVGASIVAHLGIMLIASTALFTLVGLLGPIIRSLTGYSGLGIAVLQVIAGLSSLAGIRLGARYAMGQNRSLLAVLFLVLAVSLAVVVPSLGLQQAGSIGLGTIFVSVVLGPVAQFAIGATVQARLAALAGSSATFVFALNASMVYFGQGLGIALGAAALDLSGIASAPAIGTAIALTGCLLAVWLGHFTKNLFQTARG
ncbi:hypothetical protein BKI51_09765 [Alphaproteobacteria bacterium AO1-B]|nr:hypothetical protein BKI51_09765 [Alphaproteobacteria bacterium AO1-B]